MNKVLIIIVGIVFLLAGSGMYGWISFEKDKEQKINDKYESKSDSWAAEFIDQFKTEGYDKRKLESQQHDNLKADLDELASGEKNISIDADILYGENWREEIDKYKKKKEFREFILTSSIVCISMGVIIFSWYLFVGLIKVIIRIISVVKERFSGAHEKRQAVENYKEPEEVYFEKYIIEEDQGQKEPPQEEQNHLKKRTKTAWSSSNSKSKNAGAEQAVSTKSRSIPKKKPRKETKKDLDTKSDEYAKKIAVLLSDEESVRSLEQFEDSLKAQTAELQERTAESVQKAILEHSKPLDSTLRDLAQQVSAIREYASSQQERVEKLQDGYDWNIIKTFCLRIIRCIDNLDNRIGRLSSKGVETEHLEDIRDELVFALESSGIEQYEPEMNSDYHGQEKYAEAVKEKEHCNDQEQKGKIAKVIRPGYQYFISEDNIKIVRTAQVKLFG
ncbi:MAG: hypothetical protein JW837_15770 [Sedimentisphaerales bacterium]|nr:hypothetical protein [Sedimentisphaerales bacterium]